jgi:hypothetical protein
VTRKSRRAAAAESESGVGLPPLPYTTQWHRDHGRGTRRDKAIKQQLLTPREEQAMVVSIQSWKSNEIRHSQLLHKTPLCVPLGPLEQTLAEQCPVQISPLFSFSLLLSSSPQDAPQWVRELLTRDKYAYIHSHSQLQVHQQQFKTMHCFRT